VSSTIHSSRPTPPEKSFGQKLKEFFSSPGLVLMTLGGIVLVLGVPYMALRTIPGMEHPFSSAEPAPKGDPNAGINFAELETLPYDYSFGASDILNREDPAIPESLLGLEEPSTFELIYPVTESVESVQPTLSWMMFAPGPYEVAILDAARQVVVSARNVANLAWVVPTRLNRGAVYSWKVTAANKQFETASFIVLKEEQVMEWQEVRSQHANSHLALGVTAEQLGMLSVAEREYTELARQFPQAEAPARLLALRE
jgi:hypothetical protein